MITSLHLLFALLVQSILAGSCKKDAGKISVPDISTGSSIITVVEDTPSAAVSVPVTLSAAPDKTVSLDYSTSDSTAIAGKDYEAVVTGKLTFQPGETSKVIKINILRDTAQKQDVCFRLVFSNPSNGVLVQSDQVIKITNVDYASLVWSDEFNAGPLNMATWNYEQGAGGWGNNELQNYTSSVNNVHIDTGFLHISALKPSGNSYTSGRITTSGKKQFTYCRVDIRAKLPEGKGIWPALWMLGTNISTVGWPKCGEIDIMELLGHQPSKVYGTLHWDENGHVSRGGNFSLSDGKFSSGFHKFTLVWTPNRLVWSVDNQQFFYLSRGEVSAFPFDLPQFFIFNVAVGGNWPGSPDQTTVFPQNMIVDYIRVYQ